uniref:indole-3-glycerol-phosphate synthase n=1 Tax=Aegilops tauschii subsp. strangulata TaxID=200361 RepID=A0A453T5S4_AEGTS
MLVLSFFADLFSLLLCFQVVGESGLFNPDDVAYVQNAGVSAVLVGESLVKQADPGRAIAGLFGKELVH